MHGGEGGFLLAEIIISVGKELRIKKLAHNLHGHHELSCY